MVSPLLKKHIRLGHAGIVDHSVDISIPDFEKKSIKRNGSMLHIPPTNLLLLTAKEEPIQKSLSLSEKILKNFQEKSLEERASRQKKR